MRIKNDYIKVKIGKKEHTLNNYIYDEYLELFSKTQYDVDENDVVSINKAQQQKILNNCFIKVDTPLEDITNATISDFDILALSNLHSFLGYENEINVIYNYDLNGATDLSDYSNYDKTKFLGKKITALGFGNTYGEVLACLDTTDYDIRILDDEGIYITRKDIITTEATCYGYEYPVHLSPIGDEKNAIYNDYLQDYEPKYAKLYSVGFSKTLGVENEEYIIDDDINIKIESDTSFGFNLRKGEDVSIYPQEELFAGNDLYPMPLFVQREIYPAIDLQPSNDLYPSDSNYKYIFYKFRLYLIHWNENNYLEIQWLNEYYTMYLENNTKGLFEIVTKIERSDD